MRGIAYTFFVVVVMLLSTSCEKTIELKSVNLGNRIAVNAVISPDTVVMAAIGTVRDIEPDDLSQSEDNPTFTTEYNGLYEYRYKYATFVMNYKPIMSKIKAVVVLNDKEEYPMWLNTDTLDSRFVSDCRPQMGDKVEIFAEVDSVGFNPVRASAVIPVAQKIEVVGHEVVYSENTPLKYHGYDMPDRTGADSVMRVTLKIYDPANEVNFYRLRVVGAGDKHATELFSSDDELFYDPDLVNEYGFIIPAYFSNVFSDELINGKEYTFTVESRKRKEANARTIIELQSISADLYYFVKSYMKYRIAEFDSFDVPIGINSNVEDGWGIFGAANSDTHTIYYYAE